MFKIGKCYKLNMPGYGLFNNEKLEQRIQDSIRFGEIFILLNLYNTYLLGVGRIFLVKILHKNKIQYTFFRQSDIQNIIEL